MITQQRLHELFEYREDGNLIWKMNIQSMARKGNVAGSTDYHGYTRISIDCKKYLLHRLIFLYHKGYLTHGLQIDHIDGNQRNNRIDNLREVTGSQNMYNSKIRSNNKSGVKGVYWNKATRKWYPQIKVNGKYVLRGYYDTIEEAAAAIEKARNEYHGEYARHDQR